jgi:hypothetical protein
MRILRLLKPQLLTMRPIIFFFCLAISFFVTSCGTQSVYLQNLVVEGPQVQPPLFMTRGNAPGDFRIAPRIAVGVGQTLEGRAKGHSNVDSSGRYRVDAVQENGRTRYIERAGANTVPFQGRNFRWEPARLNAAVDFDYVAAKSLALVGGINYSSTAAKSFLGANLGVGFFFESDNVAVRVDVGAHWSSTTYDVAYVVATKPFSFGEAETEVAFFNEQGRDSYANAYGAFTLNTKAPSLPLQFFAQLAINRQTVVNLKRETDFLIDRSSVLQSVSYFIVTPGVFVDLSAKSRVLVGVHLRDETELLEAEPGVLVAPFVQFEFGL